VSDLKKRGLKAVILTGGGEPTLYPQFNELVQWIKRDQGLNVALITNGTTSERFEPETLSCFSWVRVSVNIFSGWEEKIDLRTEHLDPECVVGASMVFTVEHQARDVMTGDRAEVFRSVAKIADRIKARYVRLLPNVLLTGDRLQMEHAELKKLLDELNDPRFFHQHKVHGTPGCSTCHQAYFRPYLSEEKSKFDGLPGSVYPCDSVVLNDAATHFAQKFQVCNPDQILDFIDGKIKQEFNPQLDCSGCVFSHNIAALDDYLVKDIERFDEFQSRLLHEEFV
jgi:organic radical activating enzyme